MLSDARRWFGTSSLVPRGRHPVYRCGTSTRYRYTMAASNGQRLYLYYDALYYYAGRIWDGTKYEYLLEAHGWAIGRLTGSRCLIPQHEEPICMCNMITSTCCLNGPKCEHPIVKNTVNILYSQTTVWYLYDDGGRPLLWAWEINGSNGCLDNLGQWEHVLPTIRSN
jgi:hypothetical protein